MDKWKTPNRNWENIQFGKLRKTVDPKFNECHDMLSDAYYSKKAFVWMGKDWGILNKELFDKLHGLIFDLRTGKFHRKNILSPEKERIPEGKYNDILDDEGKVVGKNTVEASKRIEKLKQEGIELEV